MHASRLVELAVSAANFHRALANQHVRAEAWRADEFWVLSRARVNEWSRLMKECEQSKSRRDAPFQPKLFWQSVGPILEEIFLAEVCTRVWCATLTSIDEHRSYGELAPIAQSVFVANLEVRRRALRMLLFSKGLTAISTLSANLLRRDCEVWTDGLLAQILPLRVAQQFGFDRQRIQRFAQHRDPITAISSNSVKPVSMSAFQLISIQYGLSVREMQDSVCDELNSELAANILSNLPAEGFNGCGEPGLAWATDSFCSDMLSISILEDLCGNSPRPRYDVPGGLLDRR